MYMKNNSLFELLLGLLFFIVAFFYNNRKTKKEEKTSALIDMYYYKINIACVFGIILFLVSIIRRLF